MEIELRRTDSSDLDFQKLVAELDADLAIRDGEDHAFYAQFNKIDQIKNVVLVFFDKKAVGCGAFKKYSETTVEVKRMFTKPENRGKRIASNVLRALENWAAELGFDHCVLETGIHQPEAIALYLKNGYAITPNFGQYAGVETSVCFAKIIGQLAPS